MSVLCAGVVLLASCGSELPPGPRAAQSPGPQQQPIEPSQPIEPVSPAPTVQEPVATQTPTPTGCEVRLDLEVKQIGTTRELLVMIENRSDRVIEFDVPERCPNGPVDFEGLGPGYDYYGTCAAGACAGVSPTRHVTLTPHDRHMFAQAFVNVNGKPPCTTALAPGRYVVRPIAPKTTIPFCVGQAVIEVPPPAAATKVESDPYSCKSSSDCVLSCPTAPGCCGYPCGCKHAINVLHRAEYEANFAKTCERSPCPAMGCSYEPAELAICRNGRCVAGSMNELVSPARSPLR